jgi:hypothetical protein
MNCAGPFNMFDRSDPQFFSARLTSVIISIEGIMARFYILAKAATTFDDSALYSGGIRFEPRLCLLEHFVLIRSISKRMYLEIRHGYLLSHDQTSQTSG